MKIVFVGAGNLATNVARALKDAGHEITQVYSRTQASADALASQVGAEAVSDLDGVAREADIYIVSVKDGALSDVVARLCDGSRRGLFVHTAGSIPMSIFDGTYELYNECAILFRDAAGRPVSRRPDRVMVKEKEAVVVDYKSARPTEAHRRQVAQYVELLRRMGYEKVSGFVWYVLHDELRAV